MAEHLQHHGKKDHTSIIVVTVGALGLAGMYLYSQYKQGNQGTAAQNSLGSAYSQGTPVSAGTEVEEPNSYSSTPIIQNYMSSQTTTNPTTVVHAFNKPNPFPVHPPTSPFRGKGH
jgi:hypothetical protein